MDHLVFHSSLSNPRRWLPFHFGPVRVIPTDRNKAREAKFDRKGESAMMLSFPRPEPDPVPPPAPTPTPTPFPPKPVREPDPSRLPDEEPIPNPDEDRNPTRNTTL